MDSQELMDLLREQTGATRTTLRAAGSRGDYGVVAESLAAGARSLRGDTTLDPRTGATFRYLVEHDEPLIQEDAAGHEHAPPQALRERYGMSSQMLGPIKRDGALVGIVSVHHGPETRRWSERDRAALRNAVERAAALDELA